LIKTTFTQQSKEQRTEQNQKPANSCRARK